MEFLSQMNEIVESVEENLFFCTFFMFWSAKVVLLIDSLWHHHHHKRWEPLWVRRKSICHLFPIIKTFGSFIVLCGGYFCLPNKHKIENLLAGSGDRATAPSSYLSFFLHCIFSILQFEISSSMNLIFSLFQTWILQAEKSSSNKLGEKQFIKLNISNWRIAKIKFI